MGGVDRRLTNDGVAPAVSQQPVAKTRLQSMGFLGKKMQSYLDKKSYASYVAANTGRDNALSSLHGRLPDNYTPFKDGTLFKSVDKEAIVMLISNDSWKNSICNAAGDQAMKAGATQKNGLSPEAYKLSGKEFASKNMDEIQQHNATMQANQAGYQRHQAHLD